MPLTLASDVLTHLCVGKHLLAFSAGSDSSALFHLLQHHHIDFDIAIVQYPFRQQAQEEVGYAKALAAQHNIRCHHLKSDAISKNLEHQARTIRYNYFKTLMSTHAYQSLITAHQLNDQLEWFFMQLSKGAGVLELIGMQPISQTDYLIIRPLLSFSKEQILTYLTEHSITYFTDESNHDTSFTRNAIRQHISNDFIREHAAGITASMQFLARDRNLFLKDVRILHEGDIIIIYASVRRVLIYTCDQLLKKRGLLLHQVQKESLLHEEYCDVSRQFCIQIRDNLAILTPYVNAIIAMPKAFKSRMQRYHIHPKLRPFLFAQQQHLELVQSTIDAHCK